MKQVITLMNAELLSKIEAAIALEYFESRSHFIRHAIRYYIASRSLLPKQLLAPPAKTRSAKKESKKTMCKSEPK